MLNRITVDYRSEHIRCRHPAQLQIFDGSLLQFRVRITKIVIGAEDLK